MMKATVTRIALAVLSLGVFAAPAEAAFVPKPAPAPVTAPAPAAPATDENALASSATESWKSLSRAERRDRIRAAKDAISDWKKSADSDINKLLLVIITILLPPVGVLLYEGRLNSKFWISLLLTLLFYIPGLIYSLIVIFGGA